MVPSLKRHAIGRRSALPSTFRVLWWGTLMNRAGAFVGPYLGRPPGVLRALRDHRPVSDRRCRPRTGVSAVSTTLDIAGFDALLERLAAAWRSGSPHEATACFSEDAVYVEPGGRQTYRGHRDLYELSGGHDAAPMEMTWRTTVFDPARQVGAGEYTFRGRRQFHGLVIVQVRSGVIHRWREYQYHDEGPWAEFVGDSSFDG
jgi:hypothetical protein